MAEIRDSDQRDPKTGLKVPEHEKKRIGSPAAYLGGILWKERSECRPDITLEKIAEARGIDVVTFDEAHDEARYAARLAKAAERKAMIDARGRAFVQRCQDQRQRRDQAMSRYSDTWNGFCSLVKSRTNDQDLRLSIMPCGVRSFDDEAITIFAPSALIYDAVAPHAALLAKTMSEYLDREVLISIKRGDATKCRF